MVQIGARNMQNYSLLRKAGRCGKPVLLKRGLSATMAELLLAAEYLLDQGNDQVVLCERGIRTVSDHTRNTLDVSIIPALERISHLPVIADPSHAAGRADTVLALARAAVAAGADGLMVEVHDAPQAALSDGVQALLPDQFEALMGQVRRLVEPLGRRLSALVEQA
jgi:3-deoxy-7-phosphoheptulonate synthase